ncbi:MAG: DUF3108 domain-containing protein [Candidatus Cloacimonetes bacterium]|nr:DUF3108 domain-containing protein [Candidatus Cloacimonadota bacterium]
MKTCSFLICFFLSALLLNAESMSLSIDYLGISVATVSFRLEDDLLTVTAKSNKVTNVFTSSFDNTYRTVLDSLFLPRIYQKNIVQSNYRENSITVYDLIKLQGKFRDTQNDIENNYIITEGTRDFFSNLFYLRTLDLTQNHTLMVDSAGKIWMVKTAFIQKEKLKTSIGIFNTQKIEISFAEYDNGQKIRSDIFTNNFIKDGNTLYIWFSDDSECIPLKTQYNQKPANVYWTIKNYEK